MPFRHLRIPDVCGWLCGGRPWAIALLLAASLAGAQGPETVVIPDDPSCQSCSIAIRSVATIGSKFSIEWLASHPEAVAVDRRGRYWILDGSSPPRVFDSTGSLLRVVGAVGAGRGEFLGPTGIILVAGDSVVVLDGALRRATVITPDLRIARAIELPSALHPAVAVSWPSQVVVNGSLVTATGVGWPLHLLSLSGEKAIVRNSFGPDNGFVVPNRSLDLTQQLAIAADSNLWTADMVEYRLTLWRLPDKRLRSFRRRPSWFPARGTLWVGNPTTPPPSAITGIVEDENGLVWVFARRAAPSWRAAWPHLPAGVKEVSSRSIAFEKLFRTVVEVIDTRAARVVARRILEGWVVAALPDKRAVLYAKDELGLPSLRIVTLDVVGR